MEQVEVTLPLSLVIKLVRLEEQLRHGEPDTSTIREVLGELVSCVEGEA